MFRIFIIFCLISTSAFATEDIILSVDNYPPYIDARKNNKGTLAKAVTEIFMSKGVKLQFKFMSWPETEKNISQGHSFSFMWYKDPAKLQDWVFSDAITSLDSVYLHRKNKNFKFKRIDQLRKYKVGVTQGYSYGDYFDNYKSKLNIKKSVSDYEGIKKLLSGETDILLIEPFVAKSLLDDWFSDELKSLEFTQVDYLSRQPIYLVCNIKYVSCAHKIQIFNKALRHMKAEGKLAYLE